MAKSEERIQNIKEYILEFQFIYHRTPTMEQIAKAVGTVKSNVYKYLDEMEERGILTRRKREIVINDTIQASPELNRVPILGNVSCGLPEYTEENFEEYVPLPVALFGQGDFYLLRASGNSMIEAGIDPGDLVVVRKQNTAEEGDIVVALVDNETTLKRFYRDKKHRCCRLHPENSKMKDIYVQDCTIQRIREHIEMYLNRKDNSDLKEKQERLTALKQRIDELTSMDSESAQNGDFDELFESLFTEMYAIQDELEDAKKTNAKLDTAVNRIDEMTTVMYGLKNHPVEYDEQIVRQLISSIKVISAEQILILFKDGTEMTADL